MSAENEARPDYYAVLQVRDSAEHDVIEAAYARLGEMYAAQAEASPEAVERLARLNDAYAVIGDPARRAEYDGRRAVAAAAQAAVTHEPSEARPPEPTGRGWGLDPPEEDATGGANLPAWLRPYATTTNWLALNGVLIAGWLAVAITSGAVFIGVGAVVYAAVVLLTIPQRRAR